MSQYSFKPRKNQNYWMINSRFEVKQTTHTGSEKSRKRIAVGNAFKTEADAKEFRKYVMQREVVQFDKRIAFSYGLIWGAFAMFMLCWWVLR